MKLIDFWRSERCIWATDKRFWKRQQDCTNVGVKTTVPVNKDRLNKASLSYRNCYFRKLEQENDNPITRIVCILTTAIYHLTYNMFFCNLRPLTCPKSTLLDKLTLLALAQVSTYCYVLFTCVLSSLFKTKKSFSKVSAVVFVRSFWFCI